MARPRPERCLPVGDWPPLKGKQPGPRHVHPVARGPCEPVGKETVGGRFLTTFRAGFSWHPRMPDGAALRPAVTDCASVKTRPLSKARREQVPCLSDPSRPPGLHSSYRRRLIQNCTAAFWSNLGESLCRFPFLRITISALYAIVRSAGLPPDQRPLSPVRPGFRWGAVTIRRVFPRPSRMKDA
jgi:hypothetical protein